MIRKVGSFSENVIALLGVDVIPGTPIFIGETNIEHIKSRHTYEYEHFFPDIEEIIRNPDYVGVNPKDNSIGFVKLYQINEEYIRVAVRTSSAGKFFVKSLHMLSTCNAERYIERGTLKRT